MAENQEQVVDRPEQDTRTGSDSDAMLREIVGGKYRPTSPRSLFERANEYVPTRVRAASIGG